MDSFPDEFPLYSGKLLGFEMPALGWFCTNYHRNIKVSILLNQCLSANHASSNRPLNMLCFPGMLQYLSFSRVVTKKLTITKLAVSMVAFQILCDTTNPIFDYCNQWQKATHCYTLLYPLAILNILKWMIIWLRYGTSCSSKEGNYVRQRWEPIYT